MFYSLDAHMYDTHVEDNHVYMVIETPYVKDNK